MVIKESLYKLYDLITAGRGVRVTLNGYTLRLPVRYHKFFPADYESENFSYLTACCKPGDVVVDIGAHIGLFSVCASQLVGNNGRIYAFEPTPETYALLRETVTINKKNDIIIPVKQAVGETERSGLFIVSDIVGDNSNTLVDYKNSDYRGDRDLHKVEINVTSLDTFVKANGLSKLDFIKIDAEGYEYQVLKGAKEAMTKFHPTGILGVHPVAIRSNGDSLETIYDLLHELNYDISLDRKLLSRQAFCSFSEIFDVQLIPKRA